MERLTLACLQHLPTAVLFVTDLTGDCGTSVAHQWLIREELRARFPDKAWLDVLSKADLLQTVFAEADSRAVAGSTGEASKGHESHLGQSSRGRLSDAAGRGHSVAGCAGDMDAQAVAVALPEAVRVSSMTSAGFAELKAGVISMLEGRVHAEHVQSQPESQTGAQTEFPQVAPAEGGGVQAMAGEDLLKG